MHVVNSCIILMGIGHLFLCGKFLFTHGSIFIHQTGNLPYIAPEDAVRITIRWSLEILNAGEMAYFDGSSRVNIPTKQVSSVIFLIEVLFNLASRLPLFDIVCHSVIFTLRSFFFSENSFQTFYFFTNRNGIHPLHYNNV